MTPSDFLRDPIWQFIGAALAALAIALTVVIALVQARKKELGYEILSNTRLVSIKKEFRDQIQILYDGDLVSNVSLVLIKIRNTGNVPIKADDFVETAFGMSLGGGAQVLTADVIDRDPYNLPVILKIGYLDKNNVFVERVKGNSIFIEPLLLNPRRWLLSNDGDYFTIRALAVGPEELPEVIGRIVGMKKVKQVKRDSFWGGVFYGLMTGMTVATLYLTYLSLTNILPESTLSEVLLVGFMVIFSSAVGYLFSTMRSRRR